MIFRALCCGTVLSLAASYAAACENPPLAKVPTPEEVDNLEPQRLAEIQGRVQEYHAAMDEYTTCLQAEVEEAEANDAPELVQSLLVQRNNSAVAEVQAVVQQFNQLAESVSGDAQAE